MRSFTTTPCLSLAPAAGLLVALALAVGCGGSEATAESPAQPTDAAPATATGSTEPAASPTAEAAPSAAATAAPAASAKATSFGDLPVVRSDCDTQQPFEIHHANGVRTTGGTMPHSGISMTAGGPKPRKFCLRDAVGLCSGEMFAVPDTAREIIVAADCKTISAK